MSVLVIEDPDNQVVLSLGDATCGDRSLKSNIFGYWIFKDARYTWPMYPIGHGKRAVPNDEVDHRGWTGRGIQRPPERGPWLTSWQNHLLLLLGITDRSKPIQDVRCHFNRGRCARFGFVLEEAKSVSLQ
jgi:hypothetical protein